MSKLTNTKTREEIERIASFPEMNPNPIIETDFSGKIYYSNPAAKKLLPGIISEKDKYPYLRNISSIFYMLKNRKNSTFIREIYIDGLWYRQSFYYNKENNRLKIYGIDINETKLVQKELQENEKRLKRTQRIAHLGSWEFNILTNERYWSDETYHIYGYKLGEVVPSHDSFISIVHPDDRKSADETYNNSIKENKDYYETEYRIINKSTGELRYIYDKCENVRDSSGKIFYSVGMVQDITERKEEEKVLNKLNQILKTLSSSSKLMLHATDELKYLNSVCGIILNNCGYPMVWVGYAENDKNKSVRPVAYAGFDEQYIHELNVNWSDNNERGLGPTGTAIRTGKITICKNMLTDPNFVPWRKAALRRGYASSISIPLIINGKTLGSIAIYSRDPDPFSDKEISLLSELSNDLSYGISLIRLRNAVIEQEKLYQTLFENNNDAIILVDQETNRIINCNTYTKTLTGFKRRDLLGKEIGILVPEDLKEEAKNIFILSDNKNKQPLEFGLLNKDGQKIAVDISISTIILNGRRLIQIIYRDITERKNMDQRKDDFITIAGHELRTPISTIKILDQMLQEMLEDNPQAVKYIAKIEHQAEIQANLINDLLNVSKIQTGRLEINKIPFDLQAFVEETVETIQKTEFSHRFVVKGKICSKIVADRGKIEQVLVNFCTNAIKFSPKGGKIIVELKVNRKEAMVKVIDHGIGIPKESQNRIFERFYRVYGTGNKTYPGLGMGLYISYQFIKLHNGDIGFNSVPGKGSTFFFSIPIMN